MKLYAKPHLLDTGTRIDDSAMETPTVCTSFSRRCSRRGSSFPVLFYIRSCKLIIAGQQFIEAKKAELLAQREQERIMQEKMMGRGGGPGGPGGAQGVRTVSFALYRETNTDSWRLAALPGYPYSRRFLGGSSPRPTSWTRSEVQRSRSGSSRSGRTCVPARSGCGGVRPTRWT